MSSRLKNIYLLLEKNGLDGLLVSLPANITYLVNYPSRDAYLLVSRRGSVYFADFRYLQEAKNNLGKEFSIKKINHSVFDLIADTCVGLGLRNIGFEDKHLPVAEYKKIKQRLAKAAKLIPADNLIEKLRQLKSAQEIEKIKAAVKIALKAFDFAKKIISAGKKEIEIVAELERFIRYQGAEEPAFKIIVASGENSSFPHHLSSGRRIKSNEPVMLDMGVSYLGYKSDLTRVYFLGKINPLARSTYDIVRQAQDQAIKRIAPAVAIREIDSAARQYITQQGYGGFFGHSTGHGIGLEVHEAPRIAEDEDDALEAGMVFTVEPAIYLPQKFGIRIEDMVLIKPRGAEVLSGNLAK